MASLKETLKSLLSQDTQKRLYRWKRRKKDEDLIAGLLFTITNRYYKTDGCRFKIPYKIIHLAFRSRFFFDVYEIEERTLIKEFVRAQDRVLELGGCIGVVSCVTNKLLSAKKSGHVVVEANPQLIDPLCYNRGLNNCNFLVEFGAIATGPEAIFHIDKQVVRGSVKRETKEAIKIPAFSIQDLEQKHGFFDVLIMDIQGAEYDVIKNFQEALKHFRLIIMETHEYIVGKDKIEECRDILKSNGFNLKKKIALVEAWENE